MSSTHYQSTLECGCGSKWTFFHYLDKELTSHYADWVKAHAACIEAFAEKTKKGVPADAVHTEVKGFES